MLSSADARLVERDTGLPGLGLLLDPDAFAKALRQRYPDAAVVSARARYLRYKPGTSCLAAFTVILENGRTEVYARVHANEDSAKIEKAVQRDTAASALGGGTRALDEAPVVVFPFPNDHELRSLPALADPDRRRAILRQLLPDDEQAWTAPLEVLRFKPERRVVARLGTAGPVIKLYTREDFDAVSDKARTFSDAPPLRVPRRLGKSKDHRAVAVEWIPGDTLSERVADPAAPAAPAAMLEEVGAALARLHRQKPKRVETVRSADDHGRLVVDSVASIEEIAPEAAARARPVAEQVAAFLSRWHWRARRAIHGDFSADQVIVTGDAVAIIDLDRAEYGDPRVDLGTFAARLDYDVLAGRIDRARADACLGAMVEGYCRTCERDVTPKLPVFKAAALLQLAVEPFRLRVADWPSHVDAVIGAAEQSLELSRAPA